MASSTWCYFLFLILLFFIHFPIISAAVCQDHPAYSASLKPVLITKWKFSNDLSTPGQPAYIRRYTGHTYAPYGKETSSRYAGLDLFYPLARKHGSIHMSFQRPATVYLFANIVPKNFKPTQKTFSLSGWKSVGFAVLVHGKVDITYGVHQKLTQDMPRRVYVFEKTVTKQVVLPSTNDLRLAIGSKSYIVWIAEKNGKPSPDVGTFRGRTIKSNARCPDALHDVWVTEDPNKKDSDTRGKSFRTWHPAWDPCWWCAYDHEHGANPGVLNYKPMFDYTAFKNKRENEPNPGFKGYLFPFGKYWVYVNLHIQTSSIRRVHIRFHTMNVVIAERNTNEIVMDLRFKADFGFAAAVLANGVDLQAIDSANERIRAKVKQKLFRTIYVIDKKNPNEKLLLHKKELLNGFYEQWMTIPICASRSKKSAIQFTLKRVGTGILSLDKPDKPVPLGRTYHGKFFRHLNLFRTIKIRGVTTFGGDFCPEKKSGVFYTDPTGTRVVEGPGRNAVRQYVKRGFSIALKGKYEVADPWDGIFTRNRKGSFPDHLYGFDPKVN